MTNLTKLQAKHSKRMALKTKKKGLSIAIFPKAEKSIQDYNSLKSEHVARSKWKCIRTGANNTYIRKGESR